MAVEAVEAVEMQGTIVMEEPVHQSAYLLIVDQEYVEVFPTDQIVEKPSVVCVMQQQEKRVMQQAALALYVNLIA